MSGPDNPPPSALDPPHLSRQKSIYNNLEDLQTALHERVESRLSTMENVIGMLEAEREARFSSDEMPEVHSPPLDWYHSFLQHKWQIPGHRVPSAEEVLESLENFIAPPLVQEELEVLHSHCMKLCDVIDTRLQREFDAERTRIQEFLRSNECILETFNFFRDAEYGVERVNIITRHFIKRRWQRLGIWEDSWGIPDRFYQWSKDRDDFSRWSEEWQANLQDLDKESAIRCVSELVRTRGLPARGIYCAPLPRQRLGYNAPPIEIWDFITSRPWFVWEAEKAEELIRFHRVPRQIREMFGSRDAEPGDLRSLHNRVVRLWKDRSEDDPEWSEPPTDIKDNLGWWWPHEAESSEVEDLAILNDTEEVAHYTTMSRLSYTPSECMAMSEMAPEEVTPEKSRQKRVHFEKEEMRQYEARKATSKALVARYDKEARQYADQVTSSGAEENVDTQDLPAQAAKKRIPLLLPWHDETDAFSAATQSGSGEPTADDFDSEKVSSVDIPDDSSSQYTPEAELVASGDAGATGLGENHDMPPPSKPSLSSKAPGTAAPFGLYYGYQQAQPGATPRAGPPKWRPRSSRPATTEQERQLKLRSIMKLGQTASGSSNSTAGTSNAMPRASDGLPPALSRLLSSRQRAARSTLSQETCKLSRITTGKVRSQPKRSPRRRLFLATALSHIKERMRQEMSSSSDGSADNSDIPARAPKLNRPQTEAYAEYIKTRKPRRKVKRPPTGFKEDHVLGPGSLGGKRKRMHQKATGGSPLRQVFLGRNSLPDAGQEGGSGDEGGDELSPLPCTSSKAFESHSVADQPLSDVTTVDVSRRLSGVAGAQKYEKPMAPGSVNLGETKKPSWLKSSPEHLTASFLRTVVASHHTESPASVVAGALPEIISDSAAAPVKPDSTLKTEPETGVQRANPRKRTRDTDGPVESESIWLGVKRQRTRKHRNQDFSLAIEQASFSENSWASQQGQSAIEAPPADHLDPVVASEHTEVPQPEESIRDTEPKPKVKALRQKKVESGDKPAVLGPVKKAGVKKRTSKNAEPTEPLRRSTRAAAIKATANLAKMKW
ncbi:hypothetical protein CC79DRAFT_1368292 [Sarocladium strictum]